LDLWELGIVFNINRSAVTKTEIAEESFLVPKADSRLFPNVPVLLPPYMNMTDLDMKTNGFA